MSNIEIEPTDEAKKVVSEVLTAEELSEVSGGKPENFNPQPDPPGD